MENQNLTVLKENVNHGDFMLPLNVYYDILTKSKNDLDVHWHEEMEIIYVASGKGEVQIDLINYEISEGEFIIVKKGALHSANGVESFPCECYTIVFNINIIRSYAIDSTQVSYVTPIHKDNISIKNLITPKDKEYSRIKETFFDIINTFRAKETAYELIIKSDFFKLFAILFKEKYIEESYETVSAAQNRKIDKIKKVILHIQNHYKEHIKVKDLADLINQSEHHFCRFFKSQTNQTCTEYINLYRVGKAAFLLANSDLSVTDIAFETGFQNISYFIKIFKRKWLLSPTEYRKKMKH